MRTEDAILVALLIVLVVVIIYRLSRGKKAAKPGAADGSEHFRSEPYYVKNPYSQKGNSDGDSSGEDFTVQPKNYRRVTREHAVVGAPATSANAAIAQTIRENRNASTNEPPDTYTETVTSHAIPLETQQAHTKWAAEVIKSTPGRRGLSRGVFEPTAPPFHGLRWPEATCGANAVMMPTQIGSYDHAFKPCGSNFAFQGCKTFACNNGCVTFPGDTGDADYTSYANQGVAD